MKQCYFVMQAVRRACGHVQQDLWKPQLLTQLFKDGADIELFVCAVPRRVPVHWVDYVHKPQEVGLEKASSSHIGEIRID